MLPAIELLKKYNVPVPRYTSYPTVPYWKEQLDRMSWQDVFSGDFEEHNSKGDMSLYIHLPFCEKLCTYCGCNKKITTNHGVENEYISAIHKEWRMYRALMNEKPVLRELHLGGGTPTFFSPANLGRLLAPIISDVVIHPGHEFSFEGHPNNTTREHLQALYDLGFRRVSFGVQDNNAEVQRIINRVQPFENVATVTALARKVGYHSVNFDLIYGLPRQTEATIRQTIAEVISLRPDRVAFYSYAHVPWTSRGQRLFDESDLPAAGEKLAMYQAGKQLFVQHGYTDIGMDHFALPHDELHNAMKQNRLHRNFMGYTTQQTDILLGLGVSAISTVPGAYAQNEKSLMDYYRLIEAGEMPVQKGYLLTAEDARFGKYIREVSCSGQTTFADEDSAAISRYSMPLLELLEADGLVTVTGNRVVVSPLGKNFIRNICAAFDLHLIASRADREKPVFSKAI